MSTTRTLFLALALVGCQSDTNRSSKTDPTSPTSPLTGAPYDPCDGRVVTAESPPDGAIDVPLASEVRWAFDVAEQEAVLTLTDGAGDAVSGQMGWDGNTLVLRPGALLEPDTDYTSTVEFSCGTLTASFTTEVVEPDSAWEAQLDQGTFVQPAGVGALIGGLLGDSPLLVELLGGGPDTIDLRLAQGDGIGQELCAETVEAAYTDFTAAPVVEVAIESLQLNAQGTALSVEDAAFSADLDPLWGTLTTVRLTGWVNVSTLADLVGDDPCSLLAAFGIACEICPDGVTQSCIFADISQIPTLPYAGGLVERTAYDIETDPTCLP